MSDFMRLELTRKGKLYTCECARCGAIMCAHEWASEDPNEERDAMQAGTLRCDQCPNGHADPETFREIARPYYAARYSAPGYIDFTDWNYDTNKRRLARNIRNLYKGA